MKKISWFEAFCAAILFLALIFVAVNLLAIIIGGVPALKDALSSPNILFSIRLSLFTATISTILCVLVAVPSAYVLTKMDMPFRRTLKTILELPMTLPYLVLGLCLLIVFSSNFGKLLREIGFKVVFDTNGIILAQLIINLPFAIRLISAGFSEVSEKLEFIAETLGASKWRRFITITLPLSKHALIGAIILIWSRALGEFGATLMLVGVTRMKTETLPASIYLNISTGNQSGAMAAALILLFVSCVAQCLTTLVQNGKKESDRVERSN